MAEAATHPPENSTVCINVECQPNSESTTLRLKLRKPKSNKRVVWTSDTVDNEHLNRKKSKCCCIYEKPHKFDESSSDTDDECEHCHGHVEMKKKKSNDDSSPGQPENEPGKS